MGLRGLIRGLFPGQGHGVDELARRLGLTEQQLAAVRPAYREFSISKRSGGSRRILAPQDDLKAVQRRILRRLLARLKAHPAATGFEPGQSIVTNARRHVAQAVVVRMDLKDFFDATAAKRLFGYLRSVGWNRPAAARLVELCSLKGGLPQGAPTSPRLSNLLNWRMDARLAGAARRRGATYSRYADDVTFSFPADNRDTIHAVIRATKSIVAAYGYRLHTSKKLRIARGHDRQEVTGLVVNQEVNLPRSTRRWLRAVEHHLATGRQASLSAEQLEGWKALQGMVERQRAPE